MRIVFIALLSFLSLGIYGQCEISCSELAAKCGFITLDDIPPSTDEQTLSIVGNVLTISNGNSVTLPISPDTDDQALAFNKENKTISIEDGNTIDLTLMPTWTVITAPDVVVTGSATETLEQVLETDTYWYTQRDGDCRENYEFQYRMRVTQTTAGSWAIVRVPNIPGWDRRVFDVGTYRQNGNLNNPDNDNQGAMGDAPYMAQEAHEWSNSGLIYLNQINSKDNNATMWVEFIVQYKRN